MAKHCPHLLAVAPSEVVARMLSLKVKPEPAPLQLPLHVTLGYCLGLGTPQNNSSLQMSMTWSVMSCAGDHAKL